MSTSGHDDCGCCESPAEPGPISNRPALPAIEYRAGTYHTFLQAMLRSAARNDTLKGWTSRSPRDFGMQFLDMWAYLGDILTFYQERIANEAYLRTATQRESVRRLAAAIDYRLGPGAAATVYLAFALDTNKTLTLPVGLKSQSVPGQNEKPQKFETVEELRADARWNRLRVFPQPVPAAPFAVGSSGGTLVNEPVRPKPLAAGTKVMVYGNRLSEQKEIASLRVTDTGTALAWTTPMQSAITAPVMRPLGRRFRLFGSQAPATFLTPTTDAGTPGGIRWTLSTTGFNISEISTVFQLESVVEDLKPGTAVLMVVNNPVGRPDIKTLFREGKVTSADPVPASLATLLQTVTQVTVSFTTGLPVGILALDRRQVTLYELTDAPIQLSTLQYPSFITGNQVFIPLGTLGDFTAKRNIILDDGQGAAHVALVDDASPSGDHLAISFTPALPRPFETDRCVMFGNVARATHGESVRNEILGSGDASTRLQKLPIKKYPVTFVSQPGAPNGVANTLQVRVDGVLWKEVTSLLGASADDRVYIAPIADDGTMAVQFGGEPGARVPSGRNNIVATYRQGLGLEGNARATVITTLLDRPAGLKSVVNPSPASGGSAAEAIELARSNAPNTVRTFGRIVSVTDFEDAARELAFVAKAKSRLIQLGPERGVMITVAGEGGQQLTDVVLRDVLRDLNSRRDTNRRLSVRAHDNVPVMISGRVQVNPAYLLETVEAAARAALIALFSFDERDLAEPAFISDAFRVCQGVAGVIAVDLDVFRRRSEIDTGPADVLTAESFEILTLDAADLTLQMQFETL